MDRDSDGPVGNFARTDPQAYWPLVLSVCRRYLRRPEDVEDVAQETYLKLAQRLASGGSAHAGWIWTVAYSSCVDFVRRTEAERRRKEGFVHAAGPDAEELLKHQAINQRVGDALLELDDSARQLIVARFYRKTPLRVIAEQMGLSVPTMSRRSNLALQQLSQVLRDMGIKDADGPGLAEHFGAFGTAGIDDDCDGLRFCPDWGSIAEMWATKRSAEALLPGWSRPLRVGLLISWQTTQMWIHTLRAYSTPEEQLLSAKSLAHPGLQLVAIAEPGTTHLGLVERTIREHELTGGLIDASRADEMQSLDVIVLGRNFVMDDAVARAINQAVHGGTGLLNEYWTQRGFNRIDNPDVWDLMLSRSPIYCFHSPRFCGALSTATVWAEDAAVLPGLKIGMSLTVRECGPAYLAREGSRTLVTRDRMIQPAEHGLAGVGELPLPGYILGQVGRGRAAVVHCWPHQWLIRYLSIPAEQYFLNLLRWLAAGRCDAYTGPAGGRSAESLAGS